jgi:hypothetical protein
MILATCPAAMPTETAVTDEQPTVRADSRLGRAANCDPGRRFAHRLTDPTSGAARSSRARRAPVGSHRTAPFMTAEMTGRLDSGGLVAVVDPLTPSRPGPNPLQRVLAGRTMDRALVTKRFTGGAR